jgi:hypothetical protein
MFVKPTVSKAPMLLPFVKPIRTLKAGRLSCNHGPEGARGDDKRRSFCSILWARSPTIEGEAAQDVPL